MIVSRATTLAIFAAFILAFGARCILASANNESVTTKAKVTSSEIDAMVHDFNYGAPGSEKRMEQIVAVAEANHISMLMHTNFEARVYEENGHWEKAERLLETQGRDTWTGPVRDIEVAQLLMRHGRFVDAQTILRKFGPEITQPNSHSVGNGLFDFNGLSDLYNTCLGKSAGLSAAQLDLVARARAEKVAQWRKEYKLQHKNDDSQ
jgi:hypothetical protein